MGDWRIRRPPTLPALPEPQTIPELPATPAPPDRLTLPALLTPLRVYHSTIFAILPFSVLTPLPDIDQRLDQITYRFTLSRYRRRFRAARPIGLFIVWGETQTRSLPALSLFSLSPPLPSVIGWAIDEFVDPPFFPRLPTIQLFPRFPSSPPFPPLPIA